MMWTLIGGAWYADDGITAPPPPNLPANNNGSPWKNYDRYDDAPAQAAPVAPYAAGAWHDGNYCITHANDASYSILVDSHQKKHIASWPSHYQGKPGTKFPKGWKNADVIAYAEALVASYGALRTTPAADLIQNNVTVNLHHAPSGKAAAVASVIVNSASWDADRRCWAFHFYPA